MLTTSLATEAGGHEMPRVVVYADYVRVLSRVGLSAVLVSPAHDGDDIDVLVDASCGLVLSGGEDIEPRRYGEEPIPDLYDVNPMRDAMEWHVLERALDADLPVFGSTARASWEDPHLRVLEAFADRVRGRSR